MYKPIRTSSTFKIAHRIIGLLIGVMVACIVIGAYLEVAP